MWKRIVDAWNGTNGDEGSYGTIKIYDFEGMKQLIHDKPPSAVLVDVREQPSLKWSSFLDLSMCHLDHTQGGLV